jgi:hypothetical protein
MSRVPYNRIAVPVEVVVAEEVAEAEAGAEDANIVS